MLWDVQFSKFWVVNIFLEIYILNVDSSIAFLFDPGLKNKCVVDNYYKQTYINKQVTF